MLTTDKKKAVCVCAVKGGVGKTLISMNLARLLNDYDNTAMIDADLDNSSFSQFTGIDGVIKIDALQRFEPFMWNDLEVFSMGLVTSRDQSVSMSGDRYVQIVDDVVTRSKWNSRYFVFDMPGGSSDIFRSVVAIVGDYLVGNVIVTQPAMVDSTRKMLSLHEYLDIPVLGVIENMSYFKPNGKRYQEAVMEEIEKQQGKSKTKDATKRLNVLEKNLKKIADEIDLLGDFHPFGESTVDEIAAEFNVPVLGKIPLDPGIAEGIKSGQPFLDERFLGPVKEAAELVVHTDIQRPGFLTRIRERVSGAIRTQIEKIMANLIVSANRTFNVDDLRNRTGFTEEKPLLLVITDNSGQKEITRVGIRVTDEGIKVLREPEEQEAYEEWISKYEFQIVSDFQTFARILMGKMVKGGREIKFSTWDAYCNGDLKAYGLGHLPRAVNAIRNIFENEEVLRPIRENYGSILGRWI